jgi:hypothetical protein
MRYGKPSPNLPVKAKSFREAKPLNLPMKRGCVAAAKIMDDLKDLASDHGISIRVNEPSNGQSKTLHVMFSAHGVRLMDYWPGTGRTWGQGQKGRAADPYKALDMVIAILEKEDANAR